ncbi:hypothetical protein BJX99DRAFT_219456 [Aspergillus californicus]
MNLPIHIETIRDDSPSSPEPRRTTAIADAAVRALLEQTEEQQQQQILEQYRRQKLQQYQEEQEQQEERRRQQEHQQQREYQHEHEYHRQQRYQDHQQQHQNIPLERPATPHNHARDASRQPSPQHRDNALIQRPDKAAWMRLHSTFEIKTDFLVPMTAAGEPGPSYNFVITTTAPPYKPQHFDPGAQVVPQQPPLTYQLGPPPYGLPNAYYPPPPYRRSPSRHPGDFNRRFRP